MQISPASKEDRDQPLDLPDNAGQPLTPRKRRLFIGITILAPLLLAFIGVEIFLRIVKPIELYALTGRMPSASPMQTWAVTDGFSAYRPKPGTVAGKTINRHGFVSTPELPLNKPPGTVRLLFLGESSTAGMGVNLKDSDTWPWKTVERIRQRTGRKIDFINGAAGGYTTFESYGRLWSRLRFFDPDIVVVYHGWNDLYYLDEVDSIHTWRTLPDGSWSLETPRQRLARFEPSRLDPLLRWSQVLTRVRIAMTKKMGGELVSLGNRPLESDFDRRGLEIFRTNLKLFRETSNILGARLLVAKQATLMVAGGSPEHRERCRVTPHPYSYDTHVDAFRGLYRVTEQEIPAESIIDVTPISGRLDSFYDQIHPTPKGTTEIAEIMSDFLLPLVEERGAAAASK
jgi:lysophospholipase L1-like esterase